MKNKSIITALAAIFALSLATSCDDMLDIDSNRVVYEKDHTLGSSADSVYSTLGILQCMQQIADRYVLLGEVRGDLVSTNDLTNTALRSIAEFNIDTEADNKYLNIKDYYAIINNCNYLLAHMDTTLTTGNGRTMTDEYVAALSVRAWTYMQLAINYGKVTYYTNPITSIADAEKDYPEYGIEELASILAEELLPYVDYPTISWGGLPVSPSRNLVPTPRLVLADLYLWAGNYQEATNTLITYLTEDSKSSIMTSINNSTYQLRNLQFNMGVAITYPQTITSVGSNLAYTNWSPYTPGENTTILETRNAIPMYMSAEYGTTTEVHKLFFSKDGTHQLLPSTLWRTLSNSQTLCAATYDRTNPGAAPMVKLFPNNTDGRSEYYCNSYFSTYVVNGQEYTPIRKFNWISASESNKGVADYKESSIGYINLYRTPITYLRAAEAMCNYAAQTGDRELAVIAYDLLRDGLTAFKAMGKRYGLAEVNTMLDVPIEAELAFRGATYGERAESSLLDLNSGFLQGVHERGCGKAYLDSTYTLAPEAIVSYLSSKVSEITTWTTKSASELTFSDTIEYIEQRIIDELALESAFEGNRFGDLMRFAKRRNDPEFLAHRVAHRGDFENPEAIKALLMDENNWYLPKK